MGELMHKDFPCARHTLCEPQYPHVYPSRGQSLSQRPTASTHPLSWKTYVTSFDDKRAGHATGDSRREFLYTGFRAAASAVALALPSPAFAAETESETPGHIVDGTTDRGAGTARFGSIATGVLFDFVVIVKPGATSSVRDFITNIATDLPASSVTVSGSSIEVRVPAALMPTQGFALAAYTSNFWPRTGLVSNTQIADFAPDNSNAPVRVQ